MAARTCIYCATRVRGARNVCAPHAREIERGDRCAFEAWLADHDFVLCELYETAASIACARPMCDAGFYLAIEREHGIGLVARSMSTLIGHVVEHEHLLRSV